MFGSIVCWGVLKLKPTLGLGLGSWRIQLRYIVVVTQLSKKKNISNFLGKRSKLGPPKREFYLQLRTAVQGS